VTRISRLSWTSCSSSSASSSSASSISSSSSTSTSTSSSISSISCSSYLCVCWPLCRFICSTSNRRTRMTRRLTLSWTSCLIFPTSTRLTFTNCPTSHLSALCLVRSSICCFIQYNTYTRLMALFLGISR